MRIAVVGSGIGGTGAAWLLSSAHDVDVYEAEAQLGGHTLTLDVDTGKGAFPIDVGFMVFNRRTYPNFTRFLERLDIDAVDAEMTFSVQVRDEGIEWAGSNINKVFAQRRNLVNPHFLRMLGAVVRFSGDADRLLADPTVAELTLGQLLEREGYGREFSDWYLIPMGDAIWSTPPGRMLDYPALTYLRFCDNHGLLHVTGKPQWLSIPGGARRYVEAASRSYSGEVHTSEPAERVERTATGVRVHTPRRAREYDAVVLATHPPQARELLGSDLTPDEQAVLDPFSYWPNDVVVHTDQSFMPHSRRAWASWNWFSETSDMTKAALVLTYRLNTLQSLPRDAASVFVTLNRDRDPAPGTLLRQIVFDHPMYSKDAVAAQLQLPRVQGTDRVWYAGAWTRYGFHEDGMLSAVQVADGLGVPVPWADELDVTRTRVLAGAPTPMLGQTRKLFPNETPVTVAAEEAGTSAIASDGSA